mmetsp:Transcript_34270/g.25350  ORF Transcript_34270/g.25350 Transcript_34270/m.25350 type:complete len:205 (+) Transcript_34270:680-1294(+)
MVYRATRGKALTHFADIANADLRDYTGASSFKLKTVYVIVFQDGMTVRDKLNRICESFSSNRFEIPSNGDLVEMQRKMGELNKRINEANELIHHTTLRLKEYLREIQKISSDPERAKFSLLEFYNVFLNKERFCYTNLNKLKRGDKLFLGYCWIPRCEKENTLSKVENIKTLNRNIERPTLQVVLDHGVKPPTLIRTNEFTDAF